MGNPQLAGSWDPPGNTPESITGSVQWTQSSVEEHTKWLFP